MNEQVNYELGKSRSDSITSKIQLQNLPNDDFMHEMIADKIGNLMSDPSQMA